VEAKSDGIYVPFLRLDVLVVLRLVDANFGVDGVGDLVFRRGSCIFDRHLLASG